MPFLHYDVETGRVICSTNAIESVYARYRRAVRGRGHFPTEQAALKCLYSPPSGAGPADFQRLLQLLLPVESKPMIDRPRNAACSVGIPPGAFTARRVRALMLPLALAADLAVSF